MDLNGRSTRGIEENKMESPLKTPEMDRAVSRVKKAISCYRSVGREILLAELMNPNGSHVDDCSYTFAIGLDGIMLAHPGNQWFAGKNFIDVRDSEGRSFIRTVVENARHNDSGFIDYTWHDPSSRGESLKTTYYEKIDGMIVCSGFYHPEEEHCKAGLASKEDYPENFFELLEYLGA
jgi:cytochrome c